jgi:ferredoxin
MAPAFTFNEHPVRFQMATIITSECINCGACEPECPNTAIYQGGVEWEHNGETHPAISDDIFYIVPEKCTECVGFFDQEACAAVCPVDCCVPDPDRPETEEALLARAKVLHPDETFAADFPSRFKEKKDEPASEAPAAPAEAAQAAPAAPAAPAEAAQAAPAAAPAAPAGAAPAAPAAPVVGAIGRVEKPLPRRPIVHVAPATPRPEREFGQELQDSFEAVMARVLIGPIARRGRLLRLLVNVAQPLLGGASDGPKRGLERAVGSRQTFSAARATVRNSMLNLVFYPAMAAGGAVVVGGEDFFSAQMDTFIFYGLCVAAGEWMVRMRESIFSGVPPTDAALRGSLYAPVCNVVTRIMTAAVGRGGEESQVGFDGYYDRRFDEKTERERRYGEVYRFEDLNGGYLFRLEFPLRVPASSLATEVGLSDEMPDYDYDISLQNGDLVVRGRVIDPRALKLTAVAGAFPPEFTTRVELGRAVEGFRHRYRDKILEIALPV